MVDNAFYLVSEAIARRSGVIEDRYRIADGRFVLDTKDLSRIRLTSDEYVTGLEGVEQVSKQEAMILIKDNGNKMGTIKPIVEEPQEVEEAQVIEETPTNKEGDDNEEQPNNEEVQEETPTEEAKETEEGETEGEEKNNNN